MTTEQFRKAYDTVNGQSIVFITVGMNVFLVEVQWIELIDPKIKDATVYGLHFVSNREMIITQRASKTLNVFKKSITKKSISRIERAYLKHKKFLFEQYTMAKGQN